MTLQFRPITASDAHTISDWRYKSPYEIYNPDPEHVPELLAAMLRPEYAYHTITDEAGDIVGFCCFGPDARVPGGDYQTPALDIGMGMRPDLTGRGQGHIFVKAVLNFARLHFDSTTFRVTIAAFNQRAQRVWKKIGFQPTQHFEHSRTDTAFIILERKAKTHHNPAPS